jgi:hypothetical protein
MNSDSENEKISSTIESQVGFFERHINAKIREGKLSTTTILAAVLILLVRALTVNTYELRRYNKSNEK